MFDWLFGRSLNKARLLNHKRLVIDGTPFVIRPVNPLLDFQDGTMPAIFTDFTRNNYVPDWNNPASVKKMRTDMMAVVKAGLISPSKADGIEVEDLFRDDELGYKLYLAVLEHSLLRFRGLKKLFFSLTKTCLRPIIWLKLMGKGPAISPLKENLPA